MGYCYFIILSMLSFWGVKKQSNLFTKKFLALVMIILIFPYGISLLNPFGLYSVSAEAYSIIAIGFSMFLFGYLSLKGIRPIYPKVNIVCNIQLLFRKKWIIILFGLSTFTLFSLAATQYALIAMQGGMGNLKIDIFELVFENNSILYFYYQAILVPLFYFCVVILAFLVVNGKFNKLVLFLAAYALIFSYIGGKRGYFSIILQLFLCAILISKYSRINLCPRKKKVPWFKILSIGVVAFLGAAYMTHMSSSDSRDAKNGLISSSLENAENLIKYQIGPYRALDYALQHDLIANPYGYTLGRATFGGMIDYYGCGLLKMVGIHVPQARAITMNPVQERSINIGRTQTWNFSYTSFYYFMYDLGYFGLILFSFLFGRIVRYSVNLYESKGTVGSIALLGFMFISCILFSASWINIQLYAQPSIFLYLYLSKREVKERRAKKQSLS